MMWDTRTIVYISFEAITGFITVIGNIIVLIAIVKTRRLHTVTNTFIGNLAVADILVGVCVAPLAALSFLGLPRDVYGCIFINSAILIFTNVSILMLLAVAVERFIAIRLPFVYNRLLTIRRAMWLNGCIWVLGFILGLIPMYGWNIAPDSLPSCAFTFVIPMTYMIYFQFFGLVILPILIMMVIYTYILCVIRKHTKRTDTLQNMFNRDRRSRSQWKKDVRAAKSFALIILLFALFWLPVNILNSFTFFCPSCPQSFDLLLTAIVLSHANSSINPFLYAASNSRIQKSIIALFSKKHSLDELSVDLPSAKDHSHVRGANIPPHKRAISIIADERIEDNQSNLGIMSQSRLLQNENNSPTHKNSKDWDHLFPKLSVLNNESTKDSINAVTHNNSPNSPPDIEEDTMLAKGSIPGTLQEVFPASGDQTKTQYGKEQYQNNCSKYMSDHIITDYDQLKTYQHATTHASPKNTSGHVNFAFIDDTAYTDDSSGSHLMERTCAIESNHVKSHNELKSEGEKNFNVNVEQLEENFSKDHKRGSLEVAEKDMLGREITQCSPYRSPELFEMVDEPADDQECGHIVFVADKEDGKCCKSGTVGNNVTHSYFQGQLRDRDDYITGVDISSNRIYINSESQQTKL